MVKFLLANSKLELIEMNVYKGYEDKADTMFGALFRNTAKVAL